MDERETEIKSKILEGVSTSELMMFYNISPNTLVRYRKELREEGYETNSTGRPKEYNLHDRDDLDDIRYDYYEADMKVEDIVDKYELGNLQNFYRLKKIHGWRNKQGGILTAEAVENAIYEYEHNPHKSVSEICKDAGISQPTLYIAMEERAIPRRRGKYKNTGDESWKE